MRSMVQLTFDYVYVDLSLNLWLALVFTRAALVELQAALPGDIISLRSYRAYSAIYKLAKQLTTCTLSFLDLYSQAYLRSSQQLRPRSASLSSAYAQRLPIIINNEPKFLAAH